MKYESVAWYTSMALPPGAVEDWTYTHRGGAVTLDGLQRELEAWLRLPNRLYFIIQLLPEGGLAPTVPLSVLLG